MLSQTWPGVAPHVFSALQQTAAPSGSVEVELHILRKNIRGNPKKNKPRLRKTYKTRTELRGKVLHFKGETNAAVLNRNGNALRERS
jgi:hypothetical protein